MSAYTSHLCHKPIPCLWGLSVQCGFQPALLGCNTRWLPSMACHQAAPLILQQIPEDQGEKPLSGDLPL